VWQEVKGGAIASCKFLPVRKLSSSVNLLPKALNLGLEIPHFGENSGKNLHFEQA